MALIAVAMLIASVACTSVPAPIPMPETIRQPMPEITPQPTPETTSETAANLAPSEQVPRITIEELLQKLESGADILVVDTRTREEYVVDHIRGAVSAPLSAIVGGQWVPPTDKEIILYCG